MERREFHILFLIKEAWFIANSNTITKQKNKQFETYYKQKAHNI